LKPGRYHSAAWSGFFESRALRNRRPLTCKDVFQSSFKSNQAFNDPQLGALPAKFRQKIAERLDPDRGDWHPGDPHAGVDSCSPFQGTHNDAASGPKSVEPRPFYVCDQARSLTPPSLIVFASRGDVGQYKTRGQSRGNGYIGRWSSSMAQTSGSFSHSRPIGLSVEIRTGFGLKIRMLGSSLK